MLALCSTLSLGFNTWTHFQLIDDAGSRYAATDNEKPETVNCGQQSNTNKNNNSHNVPLFYNKTENDAKLSLFIPAIPKHSLPRCNVELNNKQIYLSFIDDKAENGTSLSELSWKANGFPMRNATLTALCLLDKENISHYWLTAVPHFLQWTLSCFSFHQHVLEHNAHLKKAGVKLEFGIWWNNINITGPKLGNGIRGEPDIKQIAPRMFQCDMQKDIYFSGNKYKRNYGFARIKKGVRDDSILIYRPSNMQMRHWSKPTWFEKPLDAALFQKLFFASPLNAHKDERRKSLHKFLQKEGHLNIGLIQRRTTRKISNLEAIKKLLQEKYTRAHVDQVHTEDMTFQEKAEWFHLQDIVIAVHGGDLTNIVFMDMSMNPSVVEIFSPHFYELDYYLPLSRSMNINHFQWTPSNLSRSDAMKDLEHTRSDLRVKRLDVSPPVDEILSLVNQAIVSMKVQYI